LDRFDVESNKIVKLVENSVKNDEHTHMYVYMWQLVEGEWNLLSKRNFKWQWDGFWTAECLNACTTQPKTV